jgi:hypothetical protein
MEQLREMFNRTVVWRRNIVVTALMVLGFAGTVSAQDNSLALVPKDAYFYQSTLRLGEQLQTILKSKAWATLNSLPAVKMGWQKFKEEWDQQGGNLAMFRQWYEQDDNRELVKFLGQLGAEEMFCYGGRDSIEFVQLLGDLNTTNQFAPLTELLKAGNLGGPGGVKAENRIALLLQTLAQNPDRIKIPDLVFGFKLSDTTLAKKQLERLDNLVQGVPPLNQFVKKTKIAGGQFLSVELDGSLVPWEQLPIRNFEEKPGDFDRLMKRLKNLKINLTLGLREQFMLVTLGESTAALEALGKGATLGSHPDLKPLSPFAKQRLTGISYVSKECRTQLASTKKDTEETFKNLVDLAKESGVLTPQQEARLRKDLQGLANDFHRREPQIGSFLSFTFLTQKGCEGYTYERTENEELDGSKALTMLDHLGGSPLFFACNRTRHSPQDYETLVKVIKLAHQYFEELGLSKLPGDAQQQYSQVMKAAIPLLIRLDRTTGKMLVPALADGQNGCLLDAKLTSQQWHKEMPASAKPLPMLEVALLCGVSDPALLRKAMAEYRLIANDAIVEIRKFVPGGPEINIPAPATQQTTKGTLYYYPLPDKLGLDNRLQPTAGLGEKVAVLTLSHDHANRLLTATPLKNTGSPLAKRKGPLASAVYFDWAGLVSAATPWVEYGLEQAHTPDQERAQITTALQILQCLRTCSSVTYIENGVTVSHQETVFQDLK